MQSILSDIYGYFLLEEINMTSITSVQIRKEVAEILSRTEYLKERFEITRNGKPVAALVPIEDMRLLEELEDKLDGLLAREGTREYLSGKAGTITIDELKQHLGLE